MSTGLFHFLVLVAMYGGLPSLRAGLQGIYQHPGDSSWLEQPADRFVAYNSASCTGHQISPQGNIAPNGVTGVNCKNGNAALRVSFSAPPTLIGSLAATTIKMQTLNSIRLADQFPGSDCGAKINAADADIGSQPGEIWVTQECGTTWTTAFNLGAAGALHVLKIYPGVYSTSAGGQISSFGSGITGSSPCALSNAAPMQTCPTILTAADGSNLPQVITIAATCEFCFVTNLIEDGNRANNPSGGVGIKDNNAGRTRIRDVTVRNNPTHGIWIQSAVDEACCARVESSMLIHNGADGFLSTHTTDNVISGDGEIENNGIQAKVNTSGSTISCTTPPPCWSSDRSLIGTRLALITGGAAATYVITANTTSTITVSQTIGTNMGIVMLLGSGVEGPNSGGLQVTGAVDVSGNAVAGFFSWGTSPGPGNSTVEFGPTHTVANLGWDVLILCYDTIGGGRTGNFQNISHNGAFLGGVRAAKNVFSEVMLQDCGWSTVANNNFQSSDMARAAIEFAESGAGRAGRNTVTGNGFGPGFQTAAYLDSAANKSSFVGNQDNSGYNQIGEHSFFLNNDCVYWDDRGGTKRCILHLDKDNKLILSNPTALPVYLQVNGINAFKCASTDCTLEVPLHVAHLLISAAAPAIDATGCGGSAASIPSNNGTAVFTVNVGATPGSACTIILPAATAGWTCFATDITTNSENVFLQKQSGGTTTTAVITNYSDAAAATPFAANDVLRVSCLAY